MKSVYAEQVGVDLVSWYATVAGSTLAPFHVISSGFGSGKESSAFQFPLQPGLTAVVNSIDRIPELAKAISIVTDVWFGFGSRVRNWANPNPERSGWVRVRTEPRLVSKL